MLDEVIRRLRFHHWRHAERLTPRATLHFTTYTGIDRRRLRRR